jgi:hypothetical protein
MHRDVVKNEWGAGYQRLVERVEPEAEVYDNSYQFVTDPHTEQDCPFRLGPMLPMTIGFPPLSDDPSSTKSATLGPDRDT